MNRAVDFTQGFVYVVSDLHGEWDPYQRYRDHFLTLYEEGRAHHLVFLGDLIHGYGPAEEDFSIEILLDLIELQDQYGADVITVLLGNHELAHIYSMPLSKGGIEFVPRFEHKLGEHREAIITFLRSLPFVVRTAAGVMLTHAGASTRTAVPETAAWLLNLSHQAIFDEVDKLLERNEVQDLLLAFGQVTDEQYTELAREQLAVEGPGDERHDDLLRGFLATNLDPEWPILWEMFFTQAEHEYRVGPYRHIVEQFLHAFSPIEMPQHVLVSGHIGIKGGYEIVTNNQLRIASWAHAHPQSEAAYLFFDAAEPVETARDLENDIYMIP